MEMLTLEMLMELLARAGWGKTLLFCGLLLAMQLIKTCRQRHRRKRTYREFQRELTLCRQKLESIHQTMENRPRRQDSTPSLMAHGLTTLWRKFTGLLP